jgi:hypothetical protein
MSEPLAHQEAATSKRRVRIGIGWMLPGLWTLTSSPWTGVGMIVVGVLFVVTAARSKASRAAGL